jgi:hypothetical protein
MLIFDIEIEKAILRRKEVPEAGIEYCRGWEDFENMGIACICTYSYLYDEYRVFFLDGLSHFVRYVRLHNYLVAGYNIVNFDLKLLKEFSRPNNQLNKQNRENIFIFTEIGKCLFPYDLLRKVWGSAGHDPNIFNYETHAGYGLDAMAKANLGSGKTGHGAYAPVLWQKGKYSDVVNYCLDDVRLTKELIDLVMTRGFLFDPKDNSILRVMMPEEGICYKKSTIGS